MCIRDRPQGVHIDDGAAQGHAQHGADAYIAAVHHQPVSYTHLLGLLLCGALTVLSEWKQIQIPTYKKILYVFTFPIFMFTYVPISLAALVRKVEWKPIYHTGSQKALGKMCIRDRGRIAQN